MWKFYVKWIKLLSVETFLLAKMWTLFGLVFVLISISIVLGDTHYAEPIVELVSCMPRTVNIMIDDLQDGGIMYIRHNKIAYNMQTTVNGSALFTCLFEECMVEWNREFLFIIQRKPTVQTRHDVLILFTCNTDLGDIKPGEDTNGNLLMSQVYMYLIRATASLKFYSTNTSEELPSGSYVKLGTPGRAVIAVDDTYDGTLDITVKSCEASGIPLIENRCPVDADLFGKFEKTSLGVLESNFSMFRSTSLGTGPVNMLFSCILEVCYAPCTKYVCNGTEPIAVSYRRKRSESREGEVAKNLSVATLFSVGMDDPMYVPPKEHTACITQALFTVVVCILALLLSASLGTSGYVLKEWLSTRLAVREIASKTTKTEASPDLSVKGQLGELPKEKTSQSSGTIKATSDTAKASGCPKMKTVVQAILDSPKPNPAITGGTILGQAIGGRKSVSTNNGNNNKHEKAQVENGKKFKAREMEKEMLGLRNILEKKCTPKLNGVKESLVRTGSVPVLRSTMKNELRSQALRSSKICSVNKAFSFDMLNVTPNQPSQQGSKIRSYSKNGQMHSFDNTPVCQQSNASSRESNSKIQTTKRIVTFNTETPEVIADRVHSYGHAMEHIMNTDTSNGKINQGQRDESMGIRATTDQMQAMFNSTQRACQVENMPNEGSNTNPTPTSTPSTTRMMNTKKSDQSMQQKCMEEMMIKFQACMRTGRRHSSLQKTESIRSLLNAQENSL